jgi:hypothetical protein
MENLLSKKDKEEIKIGYKRRLIVVWCWLVAAAFPVFLALVVPVYIASGMRLAEIKERNRINESAATGDSQIFQLPQLINRKSEAVEKYKTQSSVSGMVESLYTSAPVDITLKEISFQDTDGKKETQLKLSGVAKNRDVLARYERSVEGLSFVQSAEVPVESFSKPTDLDFYMNITLLPAD